MIEKITKDLFRCAALIRFAEDLNSLPQDIVPKLKHAIPKSNFSSTIKTLLENHTLDLLMSGLQKNPKKPALVVAAILAHFFPPTAKEISGLKHEIKRVILRLETLITIFEFSEKERNSIIQLFKIYLFGLEFYEQLKTLPESEIAEILPQDDRYNWLLRQHGK